FIGNRSSGRMGVAIAAEARRRGAEVTVVAANMQVPVPAGITTVTVETAAEMKAALEERFDRADVLVMAAAVSDYTPTGSREGKIERDGNLTLQLQATDDIVAALAARRRPGQILVGFAAE